MAYWSHKKYGAEAWSYFVNDIDCDILLFQESYPDLEILDKDGLVWNEIGDSRPWDSGVYSPKYKIREFSFNTDFFGAVTAAEIEINPELKLLVISQHTGTAEVTNHGNIGWKC